MSSSYERGFYTSQSVRCYSPADMDFRLTPEQEQIRQSVRDVVQ